MVYIIRRRWTLSKIKTKDLRKPKYSRLSNTGIQRRLEILEREDRAIEETSDIDDTDFDFMNVNKMHDLHKR
jgi:hypothetical protein